ncbi:hypothetical protein [Teichococcus vastitatis]|jgi:hypothetical protein|uniref:Glutamine amidotransferase n=1 Tax=Teichococcus vastitatis TaxID=2307076 RepID=A0ABS9WAL5_9PROT|nr:hypothetical protein [Pseudoroseomonas vastitatis]MCI0756346.1 hypothetical protein [Pseudoroseomonas vastitatis]
MFTLEIGGKPVAVIDAEEGDAREIIESEAFREDLQRLRTKGTPLWDGQASLNLRPASEDEMAQFDDSDDALDESDLDEDDAAEEEDDEDGMEVVFLVPMDDDET